MTPPERGLELQGLVIQRLAAALATAGVSPAGSAVPVSDHIPHIQGNQPRHLVRVDEFQYRQVSDARRKRWRHRFTVHVFERQMDGRSQAARLHALVFAALDDWEPHGSATALEVFEGYSAGADEAHAQHEILKFETIIGE
ncbi:hypothetical protein [Mangrovicoccus sp. HB161399]|uniref:tail completion protein gp17 n=1 Tax=Mangrovicoccus sp. HB161399 TaxID=2720392 RepID=UPI001556294E|nr:hypothetical protein [Mangrovicoccus sp. HB161399]